MPQQFVNSQIVMKETARGYYNNVTFLRAVKANYDDQYFGRGAKVGYTVKARLPFLPTVGYGQAITPQPIIDATVPISLTTQINVPFGWSSAQATMEIAEVRDRYINPGAQVLANTMDGAAFATVYRDIYNVIGTPGTTPSSKLTYLQAQAKLSDLGVQSNQLSAVLDSLAMVTLANDTMGLFNPQNKISSNYINGEVGRGQLGIDLWAVDNNRPIFTTGTFTASTPVVNGAGQTGSTLVTSGWASGATSLKRGDHFTIAGVNSINPLSKVSTGRLQDFVVTADATDTAGAITLNISPSIITSGSQQTVDASPANSAAITVRGATSAVGGTLATTTSPVSLMFDPNAFAFVMADLEEPNGGAKTTNIRDKDLGLRLRMVEQYQGMTDQNITRIDALFGAATVQPRLALWIMG